MLTPERIAEIEARVSAATKGPWFLEYDDKDDKKDYYRIESQTGDYVIGCDGSNSDDSDFIISARQDIPDLLAEVKRLQAEASELSSKTLQLKADNQKLREALQSFTGFYKILLNEGYPSDRIVEDVCDTLTNSHFTNALVALAETGGK